MISEHLDVTEEPVGTHVRALDAPVAVDQCVSGEDQVSAGRHQAQDRGGACGCEGLERELGGRRPPDGLDGGSEAVGLDLLEQF